jgi:hypothetical protein
MAIAGTRARYTYVGVTVPEMIQLKAHKCVAAFLSGPTSFSCSKIETIIKGSFRVRILSACSSQRMLAHFVIFVNMRFHKPPGDVKPSRSKSSAFLGHPPMFTLTPELSSLERSHSNKLVSMTLFGLPEKDCFVKGAGDELGCVLQEEQAPHTAGVPLECILDFPRACMVHLRNRQPLYIRIKDSAKRYLTAECSTSNS